METQSQRRIRLGVLASHPIQNHSPWFRHLATQMDIEVFYAHHQDGKGQSNAGFGVEFEWDTPLLEGYPFRWLNNVSSRPGLGVFAGCDTPEIYDIVKRGRFDAFLVFGWNRKSCIQAILACKQNRVPVLLRGDSQLNTNRSVARTALKYLPYRYLLPKIEAHLYVGNRNKEYLMHYGVPEDRLFFSPHFVDNDFFGEGARAARATGEDQRLRGTHGIPPEAFVFTFVGKMIPKKRPADLIHASVELFKLAGGSNVHVILAGDGPLRAQLENLASPYLDRIRFAGFVNQSALPTLYAASNAVVLPSNAEETWGLVANEAAACGIPSIVSDQAGCSADLITSEFSGRVFAAGDHAGLARAMASLKQGCESSMTQVHRALAETVANYSISRATLGLVTALKSLTLREPVAA